MTRRAYWLIVEGFLRSAEWGLSGTDIVEPDTKDGVFVLKAGARTDRRPSDCALLALLWTDGVADGGRACTTLGVAFLDGRRESVTVRLEVVSLLGTWRRFGFLGRGRVGSITACSLGDRVVTGKRVIDLLRLLGCRWVSEPEGGSGTSEWVAMLCCTS